MCLLDMTSANEGTPAWLWECIWHPSCPGNGLPEHMIGNTERLQCWCKIRGDADSHGCCYQSITIKFIPNPNSPSGSTQLPSTDNSHIIDMILIWTSLVRGRISIVKGFVIRNKKTAIGVKTSQFISPLAKSSARGSPRLAEEFVHRLYPQSDISVNVRDFVNFILCGYTHAHTCANSLAETNNPHLFIFLIPCLILYKHTLTTWSLDWIYCGIVLMFKG